MIFYELDQKIIIIFYILKRTFNLSQTYMILKTNILNWWFKLGIIVISVFANRTCYTWHLAGFGGYMRLKLRQELMHSKILIQSEPIWAISFRHSRPELFAIKTIDNSINFTGNFSDVKKIKFLPSLVIHIKAQMIDGDDQWEPKSLRCIHTVLNFALM